MRRGGRIMMIFGLLLGIITAVATLFILRTARPETASEDGPPPVELRPVVVAFQAIEPYQPIPADAVGIREWPADAIPTDVVTDVATIAGQLASSRIYPGQILLQPMILDKELEEERLGLGGDAARIIPPGQVAASIPMDTVAGVAGSIRDGDRVDIMASMLIGEELVTQHVAQNVLVLKVGPWSLPGPEGAQSGDGESGIITFVVTPEEALRIKKVKDDSGIIDLALRAVNDEEIRELDAVGDDVIIEELRFRTRRTVAP